MPKKEGQEGAVEREPKYVVGPSIDEWNTKEEWRQQCACLRGEHETAAELTPMVPYRIGSVAIQVCRFCRAVFVPR